MTEAADRIATLVRHFEEFERLHMRGLPIVNPKLSVEAPCARKFGKHRVCVLISPWFMNLVLLPGTLEWDNDDQGQTCEISLPRETLEFTVCRDDVVGTYLSAVLFRTVIDFPDQQTARVIAGEIVDQLFSEQDSNGEHETKPRPATISRRALLAGSGTD